MLLAGAWRIEVGFVEVEYIEVGSVCIVCCRHSNVHVVHVRR